KLLESFYFTIDFFEDEYEPDLITCDVCTGNKDQMGNMVDFYSRIDLINEYDDTHENHKYSSVTSGNCDWCNSLHIRCAKCGAANAIPESEYDKEFECVGGCGLIYYVDTSGDTEHIGEFNLKLIDHRVVKCSSC